MSGAVFLERIGKAAFRFVDLGPVLVPHPVEKIHVAVLAALAALDAAVPWIPDVVQEEHPLHRPAGCDKIKQNLITLCMKTTLDRIPG